MLHCALSLGTATPREIAHSYVANRLAFNGDPSVRGRRVDTLNVSEWRNTTAKQTIESQQSCLARAYVWFSSPCVSSFFCFCIVIVFPTTDGISRAYTSRGSPRQFPLHPPFTSPACC